MLQGTAVRVQLPAVPVADGGGPSLLSALSCDLPHRSAARLRARAREEAGAAVQEAQPGASALSAWPSSSCWGPNGAGVGGGDVCPAGPHG